MRYQPRHTPKDLLLLSKVGPGGLEPPTSSLSGMRSNQLSYGPIYAIIGINPAITAQRVILQPPLEQVNSIRSRGVSQ